MKIYFTRYGESQANLLHIISNRNLPHGLTERGRQQVIIQANHLQQHPITHIFTSPVPRALESGEIIANLLRIDYVIVHALREYDCGVLEGRSDDLAWQQWQDLFDAWSLHRRYEEYIQGGESFNGVRQRFVSFIQELVESYGTTTAEMICISHAGIYRLMLPLVLKNVDHAMIVKNDFGYSTCITAELHSLGLYCVAWNEFRECASSDH